MKEKNSRIKMRRKLSKIIVLCFITVCCNSCNKIIDDTDSQSIKSHTIDTDVTQSLSELGNKAAREMKLITEKEPKYHYFVERCWHMG